MLGLAGTSGSPSWLNGKGTSDLASMDLDYVHLRDGYLVAGHFKDLQK